MNRYTEEQHVGSALVLEALRGGMRHCYLKGISSGIVARKENSMLGSRKTALSLVQEQERLDVLNDTVQVVLCWLEIGEI